MAEIEPEHPRMQGSRVPIESSDGRVQTSEENRAEELRSLGLNPEDVRRYEVLWGYPQGWGCPLYTSLPADERPRLGQCVMTVRCI